MSKTERHTAREIQLKQPFTMYEISFWETKHYRSDRTGYSNPVSTPEERQRKTTIAEAQPEDQKHETSIATTKNMN